MEDFDAKRPRKRILDENIETETSPKKQRLNKSYDSDSQNEKFSFIDMAVNHIIGPSSSNQPFTLDDFQKQAMEHIKNQHSVFVTAPTSAGKTIIAKFAIFKANNNGKKAVITAPTKALVNQHYADLKKLFDVGMLTGDSVFNPKAQCLVMTTEILRKMIYENDAIIGNLEIVIFDEIHYFSDYYRGGVYQECIIHLANKVQFVFLSATVSNAELFAEWISSIQYYECFVIRTDRRPVPLNYYILPFQENLNLFNIDVTDEISIENSFKNAAQHRNIQNKKMYGSKEFVISTVKYVLENQMSPCIFFVFQRHECENFACHVSNYFSEDENISQTFLSQNEKTKIEETCNEAIATLSDEDKQLRQARVLLKYLQNGIGFHHGGLLPVLKSLVENLFCESLIKILFATDTLAMGINMPAKTVVFTTIARGFEADDNLMTNNDFIQMAGRAGRRGKDDNGNVIIMDNIHLNKYNIKLLLNGSSDPLRSSLHMGFNFVLNLLLQNGDHSTKILKNTFSYFLHRQSMLKEIDAKKIQLMELERQEIREGANYCLIENTIKSKEGEIVQRDIIGNKSVSDTLKIVNVLKGLKENHTYLKLPEERNKAMNELDELKENIKNDGLIEEFEAKKIILTKLNYLSYGSKLTLKGRIAARIYTVEGIFLTEMISEDFFDPYDSSTIAALLSCFNCKFNCDLKERDLRKAYKKSEKFLAEFAGSVETPLLDTNNGRMEKVYQWVNGTASFGQILGHDDEGTLLQHLRNLNQLLLEMAEAAATMKKENLQKKFEDASAKVFRGIVTSDFMKANQS